MQLGTAPGWGTGAAARHHRPRRHRPRRRAAATRHHPTASGDAVTGTDPDWGPGPYSFVAAVAAQYDAGHRPRLGNRLRE